MATTRLAFRQEIGAQIGRRYYASSTTTGVSTVNEVVDAARTENRDEWDGSSIYVASVTAPQTALVRGSSDGRIFLDTDLGSIPANPTAYELTKGYTIDDYNRAIDWAHRNAYSAIYDPLDDKTVTETVGTVETTLNVAWKRIATVRRKVNNSSPVRYYELVRGVDYNLRRSATGIVYEALYNPDVTGLNLHFIGEKIPSLASTDASTSEIPLEVIVPGALFWLYSKGSNADEGNVDERWQKEAERQAMLYGQAKKDFRMPRQGTKAQVAVNLTRNDGTSQGSW